MSIRRATPNDAWALMKLNATVQKLHAEAEPDVYKPAADFPELKQFFVDSLAEENSYIFIAESEGFPVGYVVSKIVHRPETPLTYKRQYIHIDAISVNADKQGRGYGKQLVKAVVEVARIEGISRITLSSRMFNVGAHAFFRKMGFSTYQIYMGMKLE